MHLVVAEKPSVARDIARVLHCTGREGYFASPTHLVTWAYGHLVTLLEPDEIDVRYKKWRLNDLPILPETFGTKVIPKTRQQFDLIKKLMLDAGTERVIAATDAGREGELIFRLIYEKAGCTKPVDRLWISSLTDAAIREGFESLKPAKAYEGLYHSALCRSQADWLVGMNASRAFTLQYKALLSVGRVQTPTLAILVSREKEIRDFVPVSYHTLTADFGDYQGTWFNPEVREDRLSSRIETAEQAQAIARAVDKRPASVFSAETQPKQELPPQLFDLTSLQREANRVLGFTAAKTLKTAQALYENRKCLTYPRTDSRYLPNDMIPRVNSALAQLSEPYAALASGIPRKEGKLPYSMRVFDETKVSDHHAIIPTPQRADTAAFTADERALFDLVARRFIAAFYPPFMYDQTTVITRSEGHSFKSTGRVVRQAGWKTVVSDPDKKKETKTALPALKQGDARQVKSVKIREETTKPPPPHTDASLLAHMEHPGADLDDEELQEALKKNGLGTPATRAAIIERLVEVGYAARRGKAIRAEEKGEKLIAVVPEDIASPVLTGKWEQALEEIAAGSREPARFMEGIRRLAAHLVSFAANEVKGVSFPPEVRGKSGKVRQVSTAKPLEGIDCPLCGKGGTENSKAFGCSAWKEGCRFTLWKNAFVRVKGPLLNEAIVRLLLTRGEAQGSSGVIRLGQGMMSFSPNGAQQPLLSVPIHFESRKKTAAVSAEKASEKPRKAPARRSKP